MYYKKMGGGGRWVGGTTRNKFSQPLGTVGVVALLGEIDSKCRHQLGRPSQNCRRAHRFRKVGDAWGERSNSGVWDVAYKRRE